MLCVQTAVVLENDPGRIEYEVNLLQKVAMNDKHEKAVNVAKVLVECGIDPSAHSKLGTALHLACACGNQVSTSSLD